MYFCALCCFCGFYNLLLLFTLPFQKIVHVLLLCANKYFLLIYILITCLQMQHAASISAEEQSIKMAQYAAITAGGEGGPQEKL